MFFIFFDKDKEGALRTGPFPTKNIKSLMTQRTEYLSLYSFLFFLTFISYHLILSVQHICTCISVCLGISKIDMFDRLLY